MGFGDLKSSAGLTALNNFLADRSYIEGYTPSQADVAVFEALKGAPGANLFHALRWYNQTKSYSKEFGSLPGIKKPVDQYGSSAAPTQNGAAAAADDDDDFDLFGDDSDDEEAEAALAKRKEEIKKAEEEKKKKKKVVIAKSSVVFDVKPWDDETDLAEMEKLVRSIKMDGLLWGASKFIPVAYGVKKLQISLVIEDAKVSTDDLDNQICEFDDFVQSVDIVAFNKI